MGSVLSQPKRLCLLAYLALVGEPVSRSTLVALFWPDSGEDRARNALSQALHYLRRSLGPQVVEGVEGDRLLVSPDQLWFDARVLLNEDAGGSDEGSAEEIAAVAEPILGGREFFQGWNAEGSQPLQEWLDGVRRRVASRAASAKAERSRNVGAAGGRAERSTAPRSSPLSSRAAWVGTGVVIGMLLAVVGGASLGYRPPADGTRPAAEPPAPATASAARLAPAVAVLLPRVTLFGEAGQLDQEILARAVHDEVVTRMEAFSDTDIVSIGFESEVSQLVRSLQAQGATEVPRWIVTISIRGGGDRARVVGLLLEGPDYTTIGAAAEGDYPMPPEAGALVELPRTIAAEVVQKLQVGLGLTERPNS